MKLKLAVAVSALFATAYLGKKILEKKIAESPDYKMV